MSAVVDAVSQILGDLQHQKNAIMVDLQFLQENYAKKQEKLSEIDTAITELSAFLSQNALKTDNI